MPVDSDGFLEAAVAVVSRAADACPGDLLTPVAAAEAHALVMLGEPGLGKTTALRAIADELRCEEGRLVWLEGSDLDSDTFGDEMGMFLQELPPAAGPSRQGAIPKLTIVIDGLDESPMVRRLPQRLSTALANRDTSELRLLVGCRTADLPPSLHEVLNAAFRPCLFVDLAPLRRAEAVVLATSAGADGERIVDLAVQAGAGSLATIPLTLQLLVRTFLETGDLNQGARWLFAHGVQHLLAEDNPEHYRPSTLEQRTAIAERIAAVLLLSGRRTVYSGPDLAIRPATDLRASVVSDGDELTPSGPFRVTRELVRDTLASQLFSSRGEPRRAFGHSSHAAFLAACYLARRRLPRRQLEGLFLVAGPDGSRTVPVPLREMAAWLAALDLDAGLWLAEVDPQSLIGHAPYLESDDVRSIVVASLLDKAEEFELGERVWMRGLRLSHPRLAEQVLNVLAGNETEPAAWPEFARCRLALRLAVHASSPELTTRLLEIAESDEWNSHMRSMAAAAALASDADAVLPRLRNVLQQLRSLDYGRVADPDDELKGSLLDLLWPTCVSTEEILPLLTARRRRSLLGSYWMFLRNFATRVVGVPGGGGIWGLVGGPPCRGPPA
jgi:DNA polymerase III delta prime subunit